MNMWVRGGLVQSRGGGQRDLAPLNHDWSVKIQCSSRVWKNMLRVVYYSTFRTSLIYLYDIYRSMISIQSFPSPLA
jgi:hypothetical protein